MHRTLGIDCKLISTITAVLYTGSSPNMIKRGEMETDWLYLILHTGHDGLKSASIQTALVEGNCIMQFRLGDLRVR